MKKIFKNILYIFLIIGSFSACQSVKDGLTGNKKSNSDEFLVEKKNRLVLPPEFDNLPEQETLIKSDDGEQEIDLRSILSKKRPKSENISNSQTTSGSLEKSISEKIKSN